MGKIKINKRNNFTMVSNHVLKNPELSLKAKGLYAYMWSLPDDWDYSVKGLTKVLKEGKDAINEALKELEREGYLVRSILRKGGKFSDMDYTLNETPLPFTDFPQAGKPITEKPQAENPQQYNTIRTQEKEKQELFPTEKGGASKKSSSYDAVFNAPENEFIKEALVKWVTACKKRGVGFQYKTLERWASILRENAGESLEIALAIVDQSIEAGWKDLYSLKKKSEAKPRASMERFDPEKDKLATGTDGKPLVY